MKKSVKKKEPDEGNRKIKNDSESCGGRGDPWGPDIQ